MSMIGAVELLTNAQINKILPPRASVQKMIDVVTGRSFNVCFGGHRHDHYDVTPQTEADAKIMEQIVGRGTLNVWRPARPTILCIGDRRIAWGQCYFMHHIRIGGGNPGAKYPSRNEAGPPWNTGGHACGYAADSVGGAGNAPNAACSAESNAHAMKVQNGKSGGQARAACYEAFLLGNRIVEDEEDKMLLSEIRKLPGLKDATIADIARVIGYLLQNKQPHSSVAKEFEDAISIGVTDGANAGMPAARWQVALMASRAAALRRS